MRCPYCTEDSEGYVAALDKNGHVHIFRSSMLDNRHVLDVRYYGRVWEIAINFCPICGRKFEEVKSASGKNHIATNWVPCTERLPEPDVYVLAILRDGEMCVVKLYDDGGWIGCRGFAPSEAVTYWMPLPEPPKE